MAVVVQRLLRTLKPKADESLTGYILRLAETNGYDSPIWIMNLASIHSGLIIANYSFKPTSSESFRLLANLGGSTIEELASITYQPTGERFDYYYLFFGNPVHRSFIRPRHPRVCPECLREAAYCRRVWEFTLITVCPVHKCMLIDECPKCERQIRWVRSSVSRCQCKFDWRKSPVLPVQDYELKLARVVYCLCGLYYGEDTPLLSQQNPSLKLTLQDLTYAVVFMAGQLRGLSITTCWPLLSIGRIKELHHLFTGAYYIFDDWPNHFYEFLNWWQTQQRNAIHDYQRLPSILYKDFGKLYTGLYRILSGSQFDFMRESFVDYLVKEWEGCDLSSFARNKDAQRYSKVKYVSKSDARRLLDAEDEWINHFIRAGRLKTKVRSKGMKRLIFIDIKDIAKLIHEKA
jgi:hypothetical protein